MVLSSIIRSLFLVLMFALLQGQTAFAKPECNDETLVRFQARAQCWHKNNSRTCDTLPVIEGTAASAALLVKMGENPQYKALKKYFNQVKITSMQLTRDYKTVLKTYYDLKKKSANPDFEKPLYEFNYAEFEKFKAEIKAAHPNNLFIEQLEKYGKGSANDITQRVMTIALEKMDPKEFKMADIVKAVDSFPSITKVMQTRFRLVFREISIEKGFPENGNTIYGDERSRVKAKEEIKRRNDDIKNDLAKEQARLSKPTGIMGGQAGRATIGAMGTAAVVAGGAIAFMSPILDLNSKRATITNCANSFGIKLSEEETIEFARSIELEKGAGKLEFNCDNMTFTEEGVNAIFNQGTFSPNQREFMCRMEEKMGKAQDKIDEPIRWDNENCQLNSSVKGQPYASFNGNKATIYTSDGTQVEAEWDSIGEWRYSSIKSLNDRDFEQYLIDKVKHPLNAKSVNSGYLNPRVLCDGRDAGKYPVRLCEISKAMRTLSENRNVSEGMCNQSKSSKSSTGSTLSSPPAQR